MSEHDSREGFVAPFDWSKTGYEQQYFHLLASLLARKDQQQEVRDSSSDTDSEVSDAEEDGDSSLKVRKARRFLDSICEAVSQKREGEQVTAAVLLDRGGSLEVLIAKNSKLDARDNGLMVHIQNWLQVTGKIERRPQYLTDELADALLDHGTPRLKEWLQDLRGIQKYDVESCPATSWTDDVAKSLICIQGLGHDLAKLDAQQCKALVLACHVLRAQPVFVNSLRPKPKARERLWVKKAWKAIKFIGRFASCFERLVDFAMSFRQAESITIRALGAVPTLSAYGSTLPELQQFLARADIDLDRLSLNQVIGKQRKVSTTAQKRQILLKDLDQKCYVHAEIQLYLHLHGEGTKDLNLYDDYIGCSKKPCYLCAIVLAGSHKMRPSHMKIWPHWTIPDCRIGGRWTQMKLYTSLRLIGHSMEVSLRSPLHRNLAGIPESNATATVIDEAESSVAQERKQTSLLGQRTHRSPAVEEPVPSMDAWSVRRMVKALRLPATGDQPEVVGIPLREKPTNAGPDGLVGLVPDFSAYWPGAFNFERAEHVLELRKQPVSRNEGVYHIYGNTTEDCDELNVNRYVTSLLSLSGDIAFERKIWHGDLFVLSVGTRLTKRRSPLGGTDGGLMKVEWDEEGSFLFRDLEADIGLLLPRVHDIIRAVWGRKDLERMFEDERHHEEVEQAFQARKALMLERLGPAGREIIDLMPPGFDDLLARQSGCHPDFIDIPTMTQHPTDPDLVIVGGKRAVGVPAQMGWKAFDSDDV